jgi:hypothetical protein|eukprot:COSAG01_NODE_1463_length_10232_cov_5.501234_7_plen_85_part_00
MGRECVRVGACGCILRSPSTLRRWGRANVAGSVSSIVLSACKRGAAANLSNEDGHLSCDWKHTPPPRVGNLTGAASVAPCNLLF